LHRYEMLVCPCRFRYAHSLRYASSHWTSYMVRNGPGLEAGAEPPAPSSVLAGAGAASAVPSPSNDDDDDDDRPDSEAEAAASVMLDGPSVPVMAATEGGAVPSVRS
jgi:hypothetical protein